VCAVCGVCAGNGGNRERTVVGVRERQWQKERRAGSGLGLALVRGARSVCVVHLEITDGGWHQPRQ
jgi:hypothetical protein